jgi:5'-nucleotidase
MKKIIAVDMDEVMFNLIDAWLCEYEKLTYDMKDFDCLDPEEFTSWDFTPLAKHPDVLLKALDKVKFGELDPIRGAVDSLKELSHQYDIVVVSDASGNKDRITGKLESIQKHFPFIDIAKNVFFTSRKELVKCDFLIDDGPYILQSDLPVMNRLIMHKPYNRRYSGVHFKNWEQITKYLLKSPHRIDACRHCGMLSVFSGGECMDCFHSTYLFHTDRYI